jgi:hypothetical protein
MSQSPEFEDRAAYANDDTSKRPAWRRRYSGWSSTNQLGNADRRMSLIGAAVTPIGHFRVTGEREGKLIHGKERHTFKIPPE